MKKIFISAFVAATAAIQASAATFIIDIDDASRVKFETGQTSATYVEQALQNGENTITQTGSEDFVLTPRQGFLIESITAYDQSGTALSSSGWSFDSTDDSYKIYFLGSKVPAYKYVVKTKVYNPTMYTLTIDINNPDAVLNGSYTVGNQTIKTQAGKQTISYNPDKGIQFYMQLRPAVTEVTFLRNGTSTSPAGTMANGTRTYKFNLADNDNIDIDVVMETPEAFLEIDNPNHVQVWFPNASTLLSDLKTGRNTLTYAPNDRLVIKAAEGYRISSGLANMSFNSYTDEYTYTFSDGDSGMLFTLTTEEYTPPTATLVINVDDDSYINYLKVNNENKECVVGDNTFTVNLDKSTEATVYYKSKWDDKLMATLNGTPLTINESMWSSYWSDIKNMEEGKTYRMVVRQALSGEYEGSMTATSSDDMLTWTISFEPAGIIELIESTGLPVIESVTRADNETPEIETGENEAVIRFTTPLSPGNYTLNIPAGLFKVNGATSKALSTPFSVTQTGIDTLEGEINGDVRWFTLQGVEISEPAEGQIVIAVREGKASKIIFNKN